MKTGTTGGSGGTVTTVTTLAALQAAVVGSAKKIVIISGTLTSTAAEGVAVSPGSNTSILGASGASEFSQDSAGRIRHDAKIPVN